MCVRPGGLPPLTFVEEYLGEIHTPWRWFEIQVLFREPCFSGVQVVLHSPLSCAEETMPRML